MLRKLEMSVKIEYSTVDKDCSKLVAFVKEEKSDPEGDDMYSSTEKMVISGRDGIDCWEKLTDILYGAAQ